MKSASNTNPLENNPRELFDQQTFTLLPQRPPTWGRCNRMTQLSSIPSFMWEDAFGSSSNCCCVQVLLCFIWCFLPSRCLPSPIDSSSYKQPSHNTMAMRHPPKLQIWENQLVQILNNYYYYYYYNYYILLLLPSTTTSYYYFYDYYNYYYYCDHYYYYYYYYYCHYYYYYYC